MAIDTYTKRRSASSVSKFWRNGGVPDVTKPVGWRAAVARSYSGIPPTPPTPGTGAFSDKFTLGTKESLGVTGVPTIGGWWGW